MIATGRSTGPFAEADSRVPWLCEPTSGSNRYVRIRPELDSVVRISPEGNGAAGVTCLGSDEKAWRELRFHSRSFETTFRETLTFERALLEKIAPSRASGVPTQSSRGSNE